MALNYFTQDEVHELLMNPYTRWNTHFDRKWVFYFFAQNPFVLRGLRHFQRFLSGVGLS